MTDVALLLVVQWQLKFLTQELQLLPLQFGPRDLSASLAGLPEGREDQREARHSETRQPVLHTKNWYLNP